MQALNRMLCGLVSLCVGATVVPTAVRGEITVHSQPQNVHLQFKGPIAIEGVTPLVLERFPPGDYLVRATGLGLVSARGRVRSTFDNQVTVQRWARPYAILMPPGLVHMERGEGWRGLSFTTFAGAGTIGAIAKNAHHDDAENDLQLAQEAYDRATSDAEITAARLNLASAAEREHDEKNMRTAWIGYTAAIWAGAAIEAWLLTSPPKVRPEAGGSFEVQVSRARPYDAGLRSLLVPGAGQRHMGRYWRSIIFSTSVYTLAACTGITYDEYLQARRRQSDAQRRYDAATATDDINALRAALDQAANEASDWKVTVWTLGGSAAAVYIWNVLDAMGLGSTGWQPKGVEVGLVPQFDGFMASLSWRLP